MLVCVCVCAPTQLHKQVSPVNIFTQRFCGANGRMSHTRSVLSMLLESRCDPSGLRAMPVTVSLWPFRVMATLLLRMSHTCMPMRVSKVDHVCKHGQTCTGAGYWVQLGISDLDTDMHVCACVMHACTPTLMVLSNPPVYIWSPASAKATEVTWNRS